MLSVEADDEEGATDERYITAEVRDDSTFNDREYVLDGTPPASVQTSLSRGAPLSHPTSYDKSKRSIPSKWLGPCAHPTLIMVAA